MVEVETSEVQVGEGRAIYVTRDWKGEGRAGVDGVDNRRAMICGSACDAEMEMETMCRMQRWSGSEVEMDEQRWRGGESRAGYP